MKRKEPRKPKTLAGDDLSNYSLKSLLDAYGPTIYKNPAKWLYGLNISESELAKYPALARMLMSKVVVVNFAPVPIPIKQERAA